MSDSLSRIETETIYPIALENRHGRPRDLFTVWFGSNMMMLTVVTGALATTLFAQPIGAALGALVAGNLVGGVFMALHAAQGPRLGVPQMIQTRGQFGLWGAVPVTALVVLMYVGFAASNFVLGGEGLQQIFPGAGRMGCVVAMGVLTAIPALLGYRMIHAAARAMTFLCGVVVVASLLYIGVTQCQAILSAPARPATLRGLLATASAAALWQIAYAPYVSDYSRYLPPGRVGERAAFHASFWGCVGGSVLPMGIGALVGLLAGGHNVVATFAALLGVWAVPVLAALSLGITVATAMNIYCGALSTLTVLQTFRPTRQHRLGARIAVTLGLCGLTFVMAVAMSQSFMAAYDTFLQALMAVMIPWTAINLTDYYLLHHGEYDVASFFSPTGGRYGLFNKPALACYVLGIAVQVPFFATDFYTGPIARMMHGIDLAWVVSLCVTAPLYWAVERRFNPKALPRAATS
ncbi:cytosine permease [Acetobacter sp. TBRC 12305]|uniref:Cytosine permease n=1 Tax=Acetobacter garciniae TaxID=2817435 RepID=A0A939HLH9_9PROT|nr:cytosine permease [Acetobacter garciniae]MBO1326653.1 cytosine permease [Acetobacter garciniae]MBX0345052.1 cytosine permease [Acetobacter garciniae]